MGRIGYQQVDLTLAADPSQDIWSIFATSAFQIRLHGWELSSNAVAASIIDINLHRISAIGSIGSASPDEEKADESSAPLLASVRFEDTTPGTPSGNLMSYQWEQLGPVGHIWTPEMRPISLVSEGFALTMNTSATPTLSGWIAWEEV